jgi:hypothetical protein
VYLQQDEILAISSSSVSSTVQNDIKENDGYLFFCSAGD